LWNFIDNIPQASLDTWYRWFTILAISLPVFGAVMGAMFGWGAFIVSNRIGTLQTANLKQAEQTIEATKRYSYIATLTFNGMVYTGGDVTMPTYISQTVEGTWYEPAQGRFRPVCSAAAFEKDRDAIRLFPDFPFAYYALAYCLEKQGSPEWQTYAEKAVEIFEQTTSIGGHQKSHDECLVYLRQLLGSAK
jgi:hypothetical protein